MTIDQNAVAQAIAAALADHMNSQDAVEEEQRNSMADANAKVAEFRNEILAEFLNKRKKGKGPTYPDQVVEIANALTLQPRLIEPVQQFLGKLTAAINEAVDKAVAEALNPQALAAAVNTTTTPTE